jgi:hypothetical protein
LEVRKDLRSRNRKAGPKSRSFLLEYKRFKVQGIRRRVIIFSAMILAL